MTKYPRLNQIPLTTLQSRDKVLKERWIGKLLLNQTNLLTNQDQGCIKKTINIKRSLRKNINNSRNQKSSKWVAVAAASSMQINLEIQVVYKLVFVAIVARNIALVAMKFL